VWVSYYPGDDTGITVFRTEVTALRNAVEGSKLVTRLPYGVPLSDHLHKPTLSTTDLEGPTS